MSAWLHNARPFLFVMSFWGVAAMASGGYLPTVGPAPLRFAPVQTNRLVQLPPPAPVKAYSVPATPLSESTESAVPFALSEMLMPAAGDVTNLMNPGNGAVIMHAASPQPEVQAEPADAAPVSPRMFLQYFTPVGSNVSPPAPAPFLPPRNGAAGPP